MELTRAVGENLKRIRKSKKLSMERLAAEAGVSRSMLGQIERGEANPSVGLLGKLAGALKVPAEVLLETRREGEELEGFTPDYLPVKAAVEHGRPGQTVQVRLVEVEGDFVRGVPEDSMDKEPVADAVKDENITV